MAKLILETDVFEVERECGSPDCNFGDIPRQREEGICHRCHSTGTRTVQMQGEAPAIVRTYQLSNGNPRPMMECMGYAVAADTFMDLNKEMSDLLIQAYRDGTLPAELMAGFKEVKDDEN